MKTSTKVIIGVVALAGVGGVGYYFYNRNKSGDINMDPSMFLPGGNMPSQVMNVPKLGAFVDGGYADYNAHVAAAYWKRQNEMYADKLRMAAMRGY